ncbi:MAG: hypothetical protein E3J21_00160 [Anaerolineales bacterium]|nr:MAG: hypothetical protein E3J21_00160 [Anaerolineales bacterium]
MALYDDLLRKLDEKAFLGFRVWDFSFRSLPHRYSSAFLKEVIFRHPLRTLSGLLAYRRLIHGDRRRGDITRLFSGDEEDFQRRVAEGEGNFLIAVGFCQKPMREAGYGDECPVGRFNHRCLYLAQLNLSQPEGSSIPSVCQSCEIRVIGTRALQAGADMHIMTSALDIAHDIFVPALERERFKTAVLCVCPYSVQPIALPLLICGIEGFVVQFNSGYCADYSQWSLADRGIKDDRTLLSPQAHSKILDFLDGVAALRAKLGRPPYHRFQLEGNIYVPV